MKKLLLLFLLVPFIGSSQTTKPMYAYNVYMGNLDSAKIFGSNNNITYNFWGIDLIKKAIKYTDSAFMLSGYARSGISYTKAQSDAKYQLAGSYLIASDLSPYLLSATAASTYATVAQNALKINITDSAAMLAAYTRTGVAFTKAQSDARYLQSFSELDPKRVTTAAFAGSTTKTLTLTLADASTVTASFNDNNTGGSGGSNTVSLPITLTGADIGADTTSAGTGLATKGYALNLANGKLGKLDSTIYSTKSNTTKAKDSALAVVSAAGYLTSSSLTPYLLKTDSTLYSSKANVTKVRDSLQANINTKGSGTVTTVSVTTANGVSGSVSTATTTPAITLILGAITPTSISASGTVTGSNLSGTNTGDQNLAPYILKTDSTIYSTKANVTKAKDSIISVTATISQLNTDTSVVGSRVTANTNTTNANVASNTTAIALKVNITDFIVGVTPSGSINSSNLIFTLPNTPVTGKEILYLNGIRQKRTTDYTISGATVTFIAAPITGDELLADYLK